MTNLDIWKSCLSKDTIDKLNETLGTIDNMDTIVYPKKEDRFKALEFFPPDQCKVVILGQDPYHGENEAMGLSFSVNDNIKIPPSLQNIFKELYDDLQINIPKTGNLTPWAKQGVLLLNSCLTVEKDRAASHNNIGWQNFTKEIIKVTLKLNTPVIYLTWGNFAQEVIESALLDVGKTEDKIILKSTHPSPFAASKASRNAPAFFGSKPFSKVNEILKYYNLNPIDWNINKTC